jgi:hypothetical protein
VSDVLTKRAARQLLRIIERGGGATARELLGVDWDADVAKLERAGLLTRKRKGHTPYYVVTDEGLALAPLLRKQGL